MAKSLPVENLLQQNVSTACSNFTEVAHGELLVAVNHNQLRTMTSEMVDPIDWSHPPLYTVQYQRRYRYRTTTILNCKG